jgi:hypothetical protein
MQNLVFKHSSKEQHLKELDVKLLYEFELAYPAWECDWDGYVLEFPDKEKRCYTTFPWHCRKENIRNAGLAKETAIAFLNDQIDLYKKLISETEKALVILKEE